MEYLNAVVPTETTHNLMRVSEANHWNKNTIKGVLDSLGCFQMNFAYNTNNNNKTLLITIL